MRGGRRGGERVGEIYSTSRKYLLEHKMAIYDQIFHVVRP